jgi:phosphohistidine phosphatase SixA
MKTIQTLLLLCTFSLLQLQAQNSNQQAIIETLNNYVDGFYRGEAEKLKAALKPRLYKFGYLKNKESGEYEYYQHMNFDQAIAFVEKMKADGRSRDENEIRKVEILDISNHIASAKITAAWGVDYVLLSKDEGQWMIEQVIWEGPYEKAAHNTEVSTYYLIRHAEKDRSNASNYNPELTEAGQKRAQGWATVFKDVELDAIYSTNYLRTQQTATPTAKLKGLTIQNYDPHNLDITQFVETTKGKSVLIVGHSNTTPGLANALLGEKKYQLMEDTNNAGLYIVTISGSKRTSVLLQIE